MFKNNSIWRVKYILKYTDLSNFNCQAADYWYESLYLKISQISFNSENFNVISFIAKQFSPEILKFSAHIFRGRWGRKDPLVSDTKFVVDSFTFISQRLKTHLLWPSQDTWYLPFSCKFVLAFNELSISVIFPLIYPFKRSNSIHSVLYNSVYIMYMFNYQ